MSDLETTQAKLRSTPTAGVSGEHSPYSRRLFSVGYKGHVQAMVAGGSLYGAIGMAIGAVVGLGLIPFTAGQSMWLIPILGGTFGLYGADTFARINENAAMLAESAELSEKRRSLLDRITPTTTPEETQEIERQLQDMNAPRGHHPVFHWRAALIGAAIGITLAVTAVAMMPYVGAFLLTTPLHFLVAPIVAHGAEAGLGLMLNSVPLLAAGAAIGGLAGSIINGLDRQHISDWMNKTEFVVQDPVHITEGLAEREQDIQRLSDAAHRGEAMANQRRLDEPQRRDIPVSPQSIAAVPENRITNIASAERLVGLDQAVAH